MSVIVVTCSHPDPSAAQALAVDLVERRLAACVSILPGMRSVYRWEGRIECCDEVLLTIKATTGRFEALKERILTMHPYAVPEILSWQADAGLEAYLDWVRAETLLPSAETAE